jgi:DNA modification methylase
MTSYADCATLLLPIVSWTGAREMLQDKLGAASLLTTLDSLLLDQQTIPQERLNLTDKYRASLLPWRGQFSPELVELFLQYYASKDAVILDPFAGSGTTLFEAARQGLTCYGAEINPSAVELARTSQFTSMAIQQRNDVIRAAESIITKYMLPMQPMLFDFDALSEPIASTAISAKLVTAPLPSSENATPQQVLQTMINDARNMPIVQNFLLNVAMRAMSYRDSERKETFLRAHREHAALVRSLPYSEKPCQILHTDARAINLPNQSIDLIITSPPYINVFNYHQNHRPIMELIGWDLLHVAKSEIGSNRKHRQNRFLTVIQYCLDISDVLVNLRRMLLPQGHAIIVVGKESSVRGVSFKNGSLVAALAVGTSGMTLMSRQERSFKNKFGELIREDILHLEPSTSTEGLLEGKRIALAIGLEALREATLKAPAHVRVDIEDALLRADTVRASPLFEAPIRAPNNISAQSVNRTNGVF